MNASFAEKSIWIQLLSMVVMLGAYFVIAGIMLSNGVKAVIAFVPLFIVAVVVMVALLVAGHIAAAATRRPEQRDERDWLIQWRAESNSSWVLGAGVLAAVSALAVSIDDVWIAHLLLLSLFLSEVVKYLSQLLYYRRGL